MLFNSIQFLIFFPAVTILYFLLPHKYRWFLLLAGWGSALLITGMDICGLPDSLKSAWQVIVGG